MNITGFCLAMAGALFSTCALAEDPLALLPASATLLKGSSLDFHAQMGNGGKDLTNHVQKWTSSNPAAATIDASGHMAAIDIGTTTITATLGHLQASALVTVDAVSAANFVVQPADTIVNAVIAPAVKVVVLDNNGLVLPGLTVAIGIAPNLLNPPGVLSGTLTRVTDAAGAVTFSDLKLNYNGPYRLQAVVATPTGPFLSTSAWFNEVPVDPCLASVSGEEAFCKLPGALQAVCLDSDRDGFSDPWEAAGGIDFNGDGVVDASEKVLTNVDPFFPDGTVNPHPSADPYVKDVFVLYDWMELPDQLTNGGPTPCTVNPLPSGPPNFLNLFYPFHSDQIAFDQHCISGVAKGHSDAPDPAALKMVIDAYAAHNIRLHLVKGHALPHTNVISYGTPKPECISDLSTQTFSGSHAADFYALKAANFNVSYNGQSFTFAQLAPFMHYAVFGHRHTCDSTADCAKAACLNPDTGRNPLFNETGIAEQPGNDFILSQGGFRDRNISPPSLAQGGTFMHELGHNLGLNHGGPLFSAGNATVVDQVKLNYKPNYLSVMNYNHQILGVSSADPNCAPGDYVCKITPVKTRLDYSSFTPGVTPNALDENNGTEANGINLGNNDIGYAWCSGVQTPIPGTGPVDFNCNGIRTETWCASGCDITPGIELNKDPAGGGMIPNGTPASGDILQPFEDWPNLVFAFQCQPTFND
jgi:hypothetical protein